MKRTLWYTVAVLLLVPSIGWTQGIDAPFNGSIRTGAFQVAGSFCLPPGLNPEDVIITMRFNLGFYQFRLPLCPVSP